MIPTSYKIDGPDSAPPLVLLNSLGSTMDMWRYQLPFLTQRFKVIRVDTRGHTRDTKPPSGPYSIQELGSDIVDLIKHLDLNMVSLCGLSLGGMIAMNIAANQPNLVDKLIVSSSSSYLPPLQGWQERAHTVRTSGTASIAEALIKRWFSEAFIASHPQEVSSVIQMIESIPDEGYAWCAEAIGHMDQRHLLAKITAPTLLVGGSMDPVTPPSMIFETHSAIKSSSLTIVPDASHLLNIEKPDQFNQVVSNFLLDSQTSRGSRIRRSVLGDKHVDRSIATANSFDQDFKDFITGYAWGEVWSRPGLDLKMRSAITIAALTALGREKELYLHIKGALRNGITEAELSEILIHVAIYAGVPASNSAFEIASKVLSEDPATW
ncbi:MULTISPECIES: alpha/beta fold hydrolase [Acidithrix]|uniref:3-oxoadipate enol-lactonase 2 n=2 Tax=root TaxID=1 RepID=A0A0D8HEG2_9ACTN|nr:MULTISPECIES: alpha/beta fold hydrolase [Acidithrix]KJF16279.1 3-oxoadipate enol-lactonase 2 [Acidithrix ferrooxidans]CAG4926776.1 unnamed protein product [Acidithrix sp. C25]